jgi:GNAT superfamily N-acetyltransferase
MKISPINADDRPRLAEIVQQAGNFSEEEVGTAIELIDDSIAAKNAGDYRSFVLADDGDVKGFVCLGPTPLTQGVYDLYWIVVDSAAHGRRYGQTLLQFAEDEVRRENGRMLVIETSSLPAYERTMRFYRQAGYPEVARIPNFYKPGDDKVIFAKELG